MKSKLNRSLLWSLLLFPAVAFADETLDKKEAEIHRMKAQKFAEMKDWDSTRAEARKATELDPQGQPDAWFILGLSNQRLEHNDEAAAAFRKYLSLNPPEEKADFAKKRLVEVEVRHDAAVKNETQEKIRLYGTNSLGFYLGFSPVYKPKSANELGSSLSNAIDVGFRFSIVSVGLKHGSGSLASVLAPPAGTLATDPNPSYTSSATTNHEVNEGYLDVNIPITQPYGDTGPISIYLPLHFGGYANMISTAAGGSQSYTNLGLDFGLGAGAALYTKSPFYMDFSILYHLSAPFWNIRQNSSSAPIESSTGGAVTGSINGAEVRVSVGFLFGTTEADPKDADH